MLDNDLLEKLYKGLTSERKKELLKLLFNESNQSMAYFRRGKNIMLCKAEILADFFDIPIDSLRKDCRYEYDHRTKKITNKASDAKNTPKAPEDANKIQELTLRNQFLEDTLRLREERIELLLEKIELYKERLEK